MKKFVLLVIAFIVTHIAIAQNTTPKIGVGSIFNYNVLLTATGQQVQFALNIISLNDPMKMKWTLPGIGTGSFIIPAKALESGTKMRLEEPAPDADTKFSDNETIMFISKAAFSDMVKTQEFTMNKVKFSVKPAATPFQLSGKDVDTFHAVSANGKVEIWVINNPDFPVICKFTGNPGGIDFTLNNVKE
ncbi:hypothetical protein ACFGVR_10840 [Mucilaginibacter sp. AW1-3]